MKSYDETQKEEDKVEEKRKKQKKEEMRKNRTMKPRKEKKEKEEISPPFIYYGYPTSPPASLWKPTAAGPNPPHLQCAAPCLESVLDSSCREPQNHDHLSAVIQSRRRSQKPSSRRRSIFPVRASSVNAIDVAAHHRSFAGPHHGRAMPPIYSR
ncbi:hypothetical protein M0R45_019604 [Rubus argutus]|uniref:Uncharacterized protein n=1 Tax=Rubus argutus TaxID=59490 RepID=A0AAW1X7U0_RUBAR